MTFIVTLIALLIERFFDWSHLRRWDWFAAWEQVVIGRFPGKSPNILLALTLLPLGAAVLFIQYLLKGSLFGLTEFIFQLLLFLYCLGPQNLWADSFACINALVKGDAAFAAEKLKSAFGLSEVAPTEPLSGQLLNNVFIAANRRIFAIVFWFLILGPVGAVLYRALTLSSATYPQQEAAPQLVPASRKVEVMVDWLPARLLTGVFALGGHFVNVLTCWKQASMFAASDNEKLIIDCGVAALGGQEVNRFAENGTTVRFAIGLLDRAFVISLVFVALVVLMY